MEKHDYTSHRELFAYELRRLRKAQGLTQGQLATMVGVSRRHLINIENAQASPTLEMMERIAAGLDTSLHDMIDFEAIERRMNAQGKPTGPGTFDDE